MKFPIFFLILLSLSSFSEKSFASYSELQKVADQEKWHEDLQWRKLMHFEPNIWGQLESQIDGDDFFLSPQGKTDLKAELQATIKAFYSDVKLTEGADERSVPLCHFPARWMWLKKKIGSRPISLPQTSCPRFEKFYSALKGTGLSLVFSSYYLNNPSSAFGHTFLRVNKAPAENGKRYELLDYGLNYAANRDTDNGLLYAIRGLFGLGPGTFTTTPYYFKVREYNNAESRDLWEYELDVDPNTVQFLVAHMWEVGSTRINYWYLTENCSYHMFTLLEAADPKVDLVSKLKKYVIPSDTVQVVWNKPNFVKSVHFRPSIRTELMARVSKLSEAETNEVFHIIEQRRTSENFETYSLDSKMRVLDTAMDFVDYRYSYEIQIAGTEPYEFKNKLMGQRSRVDKISEILKVPAPALDKPHEAHGSRRLGLSYLSSRQAHNQYLLQTKFSLHDQMDPIVGYPEYAKITFFDFILSVEESTRAVHLEDLTLFELRAMSPLTRFQKDFSWNFRVASERIRNENCDYCRWSGVSGGVGATWGFGTTPWVLASAGIKGTANHGESKLTRWWAGVGPEALVRIRWTSKLISLAEAWQRHDFQGHQRIYFERSLGTQWSWSKDGGIRAYFRDYTFDQVTLLQGFYYY